MAQERLDKILAKQGFGTRKDARRLIRQGLVGVNGAVCKAPETHIETSTDVLTVEGKTLVLKTHYYFMMNKCAGVVCSAKDGLHKTVFDLLQETPPVTPLRKVPTEMSCSESDTDEVDTDKVGTDKVGADSVDTDKVGTDFSDSVGSDFIAPVGSDADADILAPIRQSIISGELHLVGRLDIDTEGLLLLTTDGGLTHRLISPKSHVTKTYYIRLETPVSPEEQKTYSLQAEKGILIAPEGNDEEYLCKPAALTWISPLECTLVITEGRYHQVKRMMAALGNKVLYLKRQAIAELHLDETLQPGQYRELREEEILLLE
ncbi:MAG: pseudouridine synthase [Candidatus Treponema excrementipullorum]|uniref:Pseudouridine synthase n=1 Tax=Candidatus Treponema excrementipullorum TaxID=2838768 RepID=A0A9E2L229_9SPIR|nr:pseudouridine synthase [Candidatus Treponema excrementipullorum]